MTTSIEDTPAGLTSSWIWLLALYSVAGFIEAGFWGQMNAFTPLYLPTLGVPAFQVNEWTGYIASLSGVIGIPFLPFWGALADRYGRKPIIIRSFVAHLLAGVIALLARDVWVFLLARSVMSFSLGNSGLMMTTLSERAPRGRVGLAFSIMNSAAPMGAFIGPLAGGRIVDAYGLPALMAMDIALMLAVIAALGLGYRDPFKATARQPLWRMAVDSVRIILRSPRLRTLFPALFLLFAGWMLAFAYVPNATTTLYRGDEPGTAVGIVLGTGGLATLVLSPLMGALADQRGHWNVLFVGSILAVCLWPIPALMTGFAGFAAAWALLNGIVSGVFALSFSVLSSSATSEVRGRVMAFAYLPVNVGFIIGPAIGSVVTRVSVFAVFPAAAVMTAIGVAALAVAAWVGTRARPLDSPL